MFEDLLNFLFSRKLLKKAAGSQDGNPQQQAIQQNTPQSQGDGGGFSMKDLAAMAQQQADLELRKKLQQQRFREGAFMGPVQQ